MATSATARFATARSSVGSNAAPTEAELAQPGAARAWKAAQDFEAVFLGEMLSPMFDTLDTAQGPFGGGDGEASWRPILTQEIGKAIGGHAGLGLAVPFYHQMLAAQETPPPAPVAGTAASDHSAEDPSE